jgi:hypothetical protein
VKQPFALRRIDVTTTILLVLWSLSPLASQAMLRMSGPEPGTWTNNTMIHFVDINAKNPAFDINSDINRGRNSITSVFTAALLPRGIQEPLHMDAYRYPLIPFIHRVQDFTSPDADGWYDVTKVVVNSTDFINTFSSPLGIPHMPFYNTVNGTYSFKLPSSFFHFDCTPPAMLADFQTLNESMLADGKEMLMSSTGTLAMFMQMPNITTGVQGNLTLSSIISIGQTINSTSTSTTNGSVAWTTCGFHQEFVESDTFCDDRVTSTDCRVMKIRSRPGTPAHQLQPFHHLLMEAGTPPDPMAHGQTLVPTFVERYLADPKNLLHEMEGVNFLNTTQVPDLITFQRRLGRIFNTFWQAGFDPMYQTGFFETVEDAALGLNFTAGQNHHNVTVVPITALFTDITPQYVIYWPWLVTLLVCSILLLVVGIGGAIWEYNTIGPNILGFASSIVRGSKHVKVPKGGSTLSGQERARMLGGLKVMMQDVKPQAPVGKIALGTVDEDHHVKKLKHGRLYY